MVVKCNFGLLRRSAPRIISLHVLGADLYKIAYVIGSQFHKWRYTLSSLTNWRSPPQLQIGQNIRLIRWLFHFILWASPKNKQTNKQTKRALAGTPQQLWPITAAPDTKKKKQKQEILKSTAIQEKLQLHTTSYWTRQGTSTVTF